MKLYICLLDYAGDLEEQLFVNREIEYAARAQIEAFKGVEGVPRIIVKEGG